MKVLSVLMRQMRVPVINLLLVRRMLMALTLLGALVSVYVMLTVLDLAQMYVTERRMRGVLRLMMLLVLLLSWRRGVILVVFCDKKGEMVEENKRRKYARLSWWR